MIKEILNYFVEQGNLILMPGYRVYGAGIVDTLTFEQNKLSGLMREDSANISHRDRQLTNTTNTILLREKPLQWQSKIRVQQKSLSSLLKKISSF